MADEAAHRAMLHVTVCYAQPEAVWLRELTVPPHTTALAALTASGFTKAFPHVGPLAHGLALYGHPCPPDHLLQEGDRIDILRQLAFDPKESRRRRAGHRKARDASPGFPPQ